VSLIVIAALLLVGAGGVAYWWVTFPDTEVTCGCEGEERGPYIAEDPDDLQFPDAVDLPEGPEPSEPGVGYQSVSGIWFPDIELEGWAPVEEPVAAQFGFASDDAEVACYGSAGRTIVFDDFLDEEQILSAIAVAQRNLYDEASAYERSADAVYGHYRIDGRAVLAGEVEYTWTRVVDSETGETVEGEWTQQWGFVAVYMGYARAAICSYGGTDVDGVQEQLLGLRLKD